MPNYRVVLADSVISYLDELGRSERDKIIKRINLLENNPKSVGEPRGKFWILKVGRSGYRLAFQLLENDKIIQVASIEKRKSRRYGEFYA